MTARAESPVEVHELVLGLADDVERRWVDRADDAAFARAATDALAAAALPARLPTAAVLRYLAVWPDLPSVLAGENEYGEPTVTVWRSDDFHVEVIVWTLGAISLHDHVNAGAFVPLEGRRFHTRYEFAPTGTWADRYAVGRLQLLGGEVLEPGDARGILPGTAFLHDLLFAAERCTTVSIRRRASGGESASYVAPGLRLPNVGLTGRRIRALHHLGPSDPAWVAAVEAMVAAGPEPAVVALLELSRIVPPHQLGPVVRGVVERWGGELEWWADLVAELVRRQRLEALVPAADAEGRMALAALRSGIDGTTARAIGVRSVDLPDDAHGTVARSRAALRWR